MAQYRVYCLDQARRINFADWITAETDEEAVRQAHALKHHAMLCEIWQDKRLVATLSAQDLSD
jgi:hypothetical protein